MRSADPTFRTFRASSSGRRTANFYFRRVVPADIRDVLLQREIRVSLGTAQTREGLERWTLAAARWSGIVSLARRLKAEGKVPRFGGVSDVLKARACTELLPFNACVDPDTPNSVLVQFIDADEPTHAPLTPIVAMREATGPTRINGARFFADVARDYISDQRENWSAKTVREIEAILELVSAALPNCTFREIDKSKLKDVFRVLSRMPPGWKKSPLFRDRPLQGVLLLQDRRERDGVARFVMPGTLRKWWGWLKALFNWAVLNRDTDANYARSLKVRSAKVLGRRAFTDDELVAIFSSEFFRSSGYELASCYWAPVLAYYTGARANELAQIPLDAVRRDTNCNIVWIDVSRGAGFNLKNAYSEREIPIHPDIADDLWNYAKGLDAHGERYLFPEFSRNGRDGPGRNASRYVNERLLPALKIKTPGLVLHSFRHNFVQRLEATGVEDKWVRRLVGHCGASSLAIYGGRPPHEVLYAQLLRAPVPIRPPNFVSTK